jgi:hypothetical protein
VDNLIPTEVNKVNKCIHIFPELTEECLKTIFQGPLFPCSTIKPLGQVDDPVENKPDTKLRKE